MSNQKAQNCQLVRSYLSAIASGAIGDDLARFFTPDAVQIEYPNRLNPNGGQSDLPTILLRAEQGQKLLTQQVYDILLSTWSCVMDASSFSETMIVLSRGDYKDSRTYTPLSLGMKRAVDLICGS